MFEKRRGSISVPGWWRISPLGLAYNAIKWLKWAVCMRHFGKTGSMSQGFHVTPHPSARNRNRAISNCENHCTLTFCRLQQGRKQVNFFNPWRKQHRNREEPLQTPDTEPINSPSSPLYPRQYPVKYVYWPIFLFRSAFPAHRDKVRIGIAGSPKPC